MAAFCLARAGRIRKAPVIFSFEIHDRLMPVFFPETRMERTRSEPAARHSPPQSRRLRHAIMTCSRSRRSRPAKSIATLPQARHRIPGRDAHSDAKAAIQSRSCRSHPEIIARCRRRSRRSAGWTRGRIWPRASLAWQKAMSFERALAQVDALPGAGPAWRRCCDARAQVFRGERHVRCADVLTLFDDDRARRGGRWPDVAAMPLIAERRSATLPLASSRSGEIHPDRLPRWVTQVPGGAACLFRWRGAARYLHPPGHRAAGGDARSDRHSWARYAPVDRHGALPARLDPVRLAVLG